ncbi:putative RNA polymerase ECF-type sigma factor [Gordonia araii NBRC 100433]|uniref:Putative RNA polymerase ECF-type sigma factor n=1 Tax=Gordonia araii NBRC 100433 TaxID=1073574 RepID=G7H2K0_9ACTN|nr:RNA polymerase sigma factor SigJ [Gordonia araii]NNG97731.1 RNA polymerase sigma factor SigJ [Gordonia araii NBRC 100433]GAB10075.1 putative RNA polymerase ECF-type sigma factor [Gordonia araii NBRC 100433]
MDEKDEHARVFGEYRPLLFTIAYEILGSATDADDVLQESYLRWAEIDLAGVESPRAYLARVVTRQALNAARAGARRREEYVGPWLPEPILLDDHDPADDVVLAESVSTAMLVVLQSLSPDERAVFVLREVFGFGYDEIAGIVGKSADAVRQTAHRARAHVQSRRPRFDAGGAATAEEVTRAFQIAAVTGDVDGLLAVLAPDAVYTADSDGKASAARRPVAGADAIARMMLGFVRFGVKHEMATRDLWVNGMPGFTVTMTDDPGGAFWFHVVDGKIAHIYGMRNPDKLGGLAAPRSIAR